MNKYPNLKFVVNGTDIAAINNANAKIAQMSLLTFQMPQKLPSPVRVKVNQKQEISAKL